VAVLLQRQINALLREISVITRGIQEIGLKTNTAYHCKVTHQMKIIKTDQNDKEQSKPI
jgi:hypothetical protein